MKAIKLTDEVMNKVLPQVVKDSVEISEDAKKAYAVILNYHVVLNCVKESGYLVLPNSTFREALSMKQNDLISAIQELIECNLIKREVGKARTKGEASIASKYWIVWDNFGKPIKKPSKEELFACFLKGCKSSETPMGTVDVDVNVDADIDVDNDIDVVIDSDIEDEVVNDIEDDIAIANVTVSDSVDEGEVEDESHLSEETLREFEVRKVLDPLRDEAFAILENSSIEDFKSFDQLESCVTRQLCSKAPTQEVENRLKRIISMKVRRMRHQWISAL